MLKKANTYGFPKEITVVIGGSDMLFKLSSSGPIKEGGFIACYMSSTHYLLAHRSTDSDVVDYEEPKKKRRR